MTKNTATPRLPTSPTIVRGSAKEKCRVPDTCAYTTSAIETARRPSSAGIRVVAGRETWGGSAIDDDRKAGSLQVVPPARISFAPRLALSCFDRRLRYLKQATEIGAPVL